MNRNYRRHYRHACIECGYPARETLLVDEINGAEVFRLCINPTCMYYDHAAKEYPRILAEREEMYRRHLDVLLPKKSEPGQQQMTMQPVARTA